MNTDDMTHVLITVEGEVEPHPGPVSAQQIQRDLGTWWDMVPLRHLPILMGFVADNGHEVGMPYNLVGTVAAFVLGGGPYPLAGPVVITGWDPRQSVSDGHGGSELAPIMTEVRPILAEMLTCVRQALGLEPGEPATGPEWVAEVVAVAAELMAMERPTLTVLEPTELPRRQARRPYSVYTGYSGEPYVLGIDVETVEVDLGDILGDRRPR